MRNTALASFVIAAALALCGCQKEIKEIRHDRPADTHLVAAQ